MFDFLRGYRTPLMVAMTILIPLMVYRANVRRPGRFNSLDRVVLFVTTPLNGFMARLTGTVSDAWYRYVDLQDARRESVELRRQLTRLARERDRLEFGVGVRILQTQQPSKPLVLFAEKLEPIALSREPSQL
ncbi:MAG: hypothetical protein AAFN74_18190, partial [Myxococcota bacterium]